MVVKTVAEKEDQEKKVIYTVLEFGHQGLGRVSLRHFSGNRGKSVVRESSRVGIKKSFTIRQVKFTLSSFDFVRQVQLKAILMQLKEGLKSLYMCPDRTIEERQALQELKLKNEADVGVVLSFSSREPAFSLITFSSNDTGRMTD